MSASPFLNNDSIAYYTCRVMCLLVQMSLNNQPPFYFAQRGDEMTQEFLHCLKYVMVEYKPEPNTERAVKFASKLIAKAGADDICLAFFETVVNFLLTVSWQHLIYTTFYFPVRGCHVLIQTVCFFEDCPTCNKH